MLNVRGTTFSVPFWEKIFQQIVFPVFNHVRFAMEESLTPSGHKYRETSIHSLRLLCNLFSSSYKVTIKLMFMIVLSLCFLFSNLHSRFHIIAASLFFSKPRQECQIITILEGPWAPFFFCKIKLTVPDTQVSWQMEASNHPPKCWISSPVIETAVLESIWQSRSNFMELFL